MTRLVEMYLKTQALETLQQNMKRVRIFGWGRMGECILEIQAGILSLMTTAELRTVVRIDTKWKAYRKAS